MIFGKRFFREAALIIGLSVVIGLAVNSPLIKRFLKGELDQRFLSDNDRAGILFIGLVEAEDLFAGGRGFFLDARPRSDFEAGHVPGAQNLEPEDTEGIKALAAAVFPDRYPVVYCSGGDCLSSLKLAKLLSARGLKDVRVFQGGWADWKNAGLPGERADDQK